MWRKVMMYEGVDLRPKPWWHSDGDDWVIRPRWEWHFWRCWDVYRWHWVGKQRRFERFAGGFFTRRAACRWVEDEENL